MNANGIDAPNSLYCTVWYRLKLLHRDSKVRLSGYVFED